MPNYTKQHLKILQSGRVILDQDVYVCLEGANTYNSSYYYHRDRDMRSIHYKDSEDDKDINYISLGTEDTFILGRPTEFNVTKQ